MKKVVDLINKRKEELLIVVDSFNDDLDFLDNVLVNNNYSKLSGLMELNYLETLVGYLISVSDKFSAGETVGLLRNFNFRDFMEELDKVEIDIFGFLYGNDKKKIKEIRRNLKDKGKYLNFGAIELLEDVYGEELLRILIIFNTIEEMKKDYQFFVDEFDDVLSELRISERVSSKKRNKCYVETLRLRYNVDNIIRDLSVIEDKYNELNSLDKKEKREARKAIFNYDRLLENLNSLSNDNLISINLFNNLINLVEDENILRELLLVLNRMLKVQFDMYYLEYLKLSSDSEVSIQAIFRQYNINFNDLSSDIKNKIFNLEQSDLDRFLELISLFDITSFNAICYILDNSSVEVMSSLNNYVKDGFITRDFLLNNLVFFSLTGFNDFCKKIELFREYSINPRGIGNDLDVYLVSYEVIKNSLDTLRNYNLLDGINRLDCYDLLKDDNLCVKIDLFLELGYEKLIESNVGLLNVSINDIKKLYVLKNLGMLVFEMDEVVNILNNKEFLRYVDDSYLFNIVDYRIDTSLVSDKILDAVVCNNSNDRVVFINGIYLSKNRIVRNLKMLENVNISDEEKCCYALVKGSILNEDEYDAIISNKDIIVKELCKEK